MFEGDVLKIVENKNNYFEKDSYVVFTGEIQEFGGQFVLYRCQGVHRVSHEVIEQFLSESEFKWMSEGVPAEEIFAPGDLVSCDGYEDMLFKVYGISPESYQDDRLLLLYMVIDVDTLQGYLLNHDLAYLVCEAEESLEYLSEIRTGTDRFTPKIKENKKLKLTDREQSSQAAIQYKKDVDDLLDEIIDYQELIKLFGPDETYDDKIKDAKDRLKKLRDKHNGIVY